MNQVQAIAAAKEAGFTVSKIKTFESTKEGFPGKVRTGKELFVGENRISHDGFGGCACWTLNGKQVGYGLISDCIMGAIGVACYRGQVVK